MASLAAPPSIGQRLGTLVLAASLPAVFLHLRYQPKTTVALGGTDVTVKLSDIAVALVGAAALAVVVRRGLRPLRPGLPIWIFGAGFLALVLAATFYPLLDDGRFPWRSTLVTAIEFALYAVLALAAPLLLPRTADVRLVVAVVLAWGTAATVFGSLQFLGWVHGPDAPLPGDREPSFLGVHDFAALSGALLCLAFAGIVLGGERRLALGLAAAAGALGAVLSGAGAGALGILLAAAAALLVGRARQILTLRRALAVAGLTLAVLIGVTAQRGDSIAQFARFLGILHKQQTTTQDVQSYAHRSLLLYVGFRIWEGKPLLGSGFHGSEQEWVYGPYLDDAHRKFPDEPDYAFPAPAHPWGVQNAYVETLADLGIVGLLLLAGLFAAGLALAGRAALRAPPAAAAVGLVAMLWLIVAGSVWNGLGLYAGLPILGLLWLAFGLAAVAERERIAFAG